MEEKSNNLSKKQPLFSIIMPCYNSEGYIDRAIKSCINQKFDNWELIIINDGSTDKTLDIINSYASQDDRIRVFSKENGGYVSAVNCGLNCISGIYFLLLGSDDEINPSLFLDIKEHINNANFPDMIGFRTIIRKGDETIVDKNSNFSSVAEEYGVTIKDFSNKYPGQASIFFTRDTSKVFKTELLGSLRYFGEKGMDADGIFSMMFSHKASSFLCIPTIGYIWHLRHESISGRKKDYQTQVDRINNWIKFGDEVVSMDLPTITEMEKYYLVNYFYLILRSMFFDFRSNCLNDGILEKAKIHLDRVINFIDTDIAGKETKFFLDHMLLWRYCIFLKIFFKKINKYLTRKLMFVRRCKKKLQ